MKIEEQYEVKNKFLELKRLDYKVSRYSKK
jgi:hypothetical protein